MTIAEQIEHGAWTARALSWVVGLQLLSNGWEVKVWHWPLNGTREQIGTKSGFDDAKKAVQWAADILSDEGVSVFLNDGVRVLRLVDTLRFTPAPLPVAIADGAGCHAG